jgi:DNA-binding Lrp family transcriptional regulator
MERRALEPLSDTAVACALSHRNQKEVHSMPAKAFVLIETVVGKTKEVADKIGQLDGVKSADSVTGPYDVIAIVERESLNDIGDLITGKIQRIGGISRTVTCLVMSFD